MMSVRVRFAPSPTGYLHIGGARTSLYNYLYAKKLGEDAKFILRVEDTDLERSERHFEESQMDDLRWLGMEWDEGPDKGGDFGPYRQSERLDIYKEWAQKLVDQGKAYYCFCTDLELETMREKALAASKPPHYSGKWRNEEFFEEAANRLAAGEKATIRFKAPNKSYVLNDEVRGRVVFPENMVGDFAILRSSGMPLYNFCCVVDDILMRMTHIIRGEDHLSNTVRQLMVYEAFEATPPIFAHVSLLIGKDRQKLSKRHGATSVTLYREQSYEPEALANYLMLLGWSHPEEKDIFSLTEVESAFNIDRFSKAAAIYDLDKLKWVNGQHLRSQSIRDLIDSAEKVLPENHLFQSQLSDWKTNCLNLFKDQINFMNELESVLDLNLTRIEKLKSEKLDDVLSWETTGQIKSYLEEEIKKLEADFINSDQVSTWMNTVKKDLGIKGKNLFMGFRVILTGMDHGPDLKEMLPLTPVSILKSRLEQA